MKISSFMISDIRYKYLHLWRYLPYEDVPKQKKNDKWDMWIVLKYPIEEMFIQFTISWEGSLAISKSSFSWMGELYSVYSDVRTKATRLWGRSPFIGLQFILNVYCIYFGHVFTLNIYIWIMMITFKIYIHISEVHLYLVDGVLADEVILEFRV